MKQVEITQEEFFSALKEIQEEVVCAYLNKPNDQENIENMFYEITSETICCIMTLLDGYKKESVQLDIVDRKSGESLRTGIELHDKCVDYIR